MGRTVLISGAGIAGTTLALWLARHGFVPTVVESAPALRKAGYKVDVRGAAVTVLERTGCLPQVRERATGVRAGSIVTATGRRVAAMDGDTFGGRAGGDAEIRRGDLADILHAAGRHDSGGEVEYLFGESVAALAHNDDGVEAHLTGGRRRRFDLVIGADGLHSRTRALTFGPEEAFLRHLGHYVAVYGVPNHLGLDREELTYVAPRRTALTYSTAGDAGATAMFLFASDPLTYDHTDRERQQELLAHAYADEGWEVPRLLAAMPSAPDFYFDALSQVHMDRWSTGRVALVGDAAYCASPASGQGTSLAIVGAYVLAGELAAAGADHAAGFAAYETRMRPFAAANQALGPANVKRMVLSSRGQVRGTLALLSLIHRLPFADAVMSRAVAPIHRAANAITLPTY
jgi:2-polyprenyl-6-methoxyphenol hydroxylase-like FAD-dependent oxidoreductase